MLVSLHIYQRKYVMRLGNDFEYPTMQYFGNPRHIQSMSI